MTSTVVFPADEWEQLTDEIYDPALEERIFAAIDRAEDDSSVAVELHTDEERLEVNRAVNTLGFERPDDPSDVKII